MIRRLGGRGTPGLVVAALALPACATLTPPVPVRGVFALVAVPVGLAALATPAPSSPVPVASAASGRVGKVAVTLPSAAPPSPQLAFGGSSGGGGSAPMQPAVEPIAPAPVGPFAGEVRVALSDGEGPPILGAVVTPATGTPVLTDALGHFQLAALGGDRLVISAPGYATSAVTGWDGSLLVLHLQTALSPLIAGTATLPVAGHVLDAGGQPVPNAVVLGGDGHGATLGPLTTAADGSFSGLATSLGDPATTRLAIWATSSIGGAPTRLGLARVPATAAATVNVTLAEAVGTVAIAPQTPAGTRVISAEAHCPEGVSLTLRRWAYSPALAPLFALPDVTFAARVDVASADGTAFSRWQGPLPASGSLAPTLLPYPAAPTGPIAPAALLSWPAVTGATGYRVTLRTQGQPVPLWEAYTPSPVVALRGLIGSPDEMDLMALAGDDGALRSVASLAGPRQLRAPDARPEPMVSAWRRITL